MSTEKLNLVTTVLNGITTRSVEHPEHGPLIIASDLIKGLGYGPTATTVVLKEAAVPVEDRVMIQAVALTQSKGHRPITSCANFLTRKGVNLVLMFSGKPIAQETRQWLAGDVMPAIADTGGYLLNEAARETAPVARTPLTRDLNAPNGAWHLGTDEVRRLPRELASAKDMGTTLIQISRSQSIRDEVA